MSEVVYLISLALCPTSIVFLLFACCIVAAFRARRRPLATYRAPVTLLKPLCGSESGLFENLCSFREQDYPEFQIIFGVRDANDSAIGIIQQVINHFPERDVSLVLDSRAIGTNLKVNNLANSYGNALHDLIVIADSDMQVNHGC